MVHLMEKDKSFQDQESLNQNPSESGRSMVEMLGVLAIIGVLSIMGIIGYRYAIDRFHANEIIDNVTKRAVAASQQRLRGADQVDLSEMPDKIKTLYPVSGQSEANTETFKIQVQKLPKEVCDMILSMEWTMPGRISGIDDAVLNDCVEGENTITFHFWNDLRSENINIDNGAESDPLCERVTCNEGAACKKGSCVCEAGGVQCGNKCCAEGESCHADDIDGGMCQAISGCSSNADCENSEYCAQNMEWIQDRNSGSYQKIFKGVCTDKGTAVSIYRYQDGEKTDSAIVWISDKGLSWWSARNWCIAHGKHLASASEVGQIGEYSVDKNNQYIKALNDNGVGSNDYWLSDSLDENGASYTTPVSGRLNFDYHTRINTSPALCI